MKTALIVIDMQQACLATPRHDADGLVARINRLADMVRDADGVVIFIQHEDPKGGPFHRAEPGWQFVPGLNVKAGDTRVGKASCDAFLGTALQAELERNSVNRLVITGCATDYCVDTTVRSALARCYTTIVPSDGHTCSDRPHLPAAKVIEHHNAIWADFIAPAGPALVCPCDEITFS